MNQDFTVKKKQYLSEKKFVQRGSAEKKFLHKQWAKKRIVQAENSSTAEPGPMRREGRIHFLSGTFFFLHGTKEETTAVFIPILGLAVDCG